MRLEINDKRHLYYRATFFAHDDQMDKEDDVGKIVDRLFEKQVVTEVKMKLPKWNPEAQKKMTQKQRKSLKQEWRGKVKQLNVKWIHQMMEEDKGLIEKMTFFWSGHFVCRTVDNPYAAISFNNILRKNALGNFRDLLFAVSKSSSMISYLHLKQNRKNKPNEDFARELCELFTLGRDVDYTEKDVTEIARAFTGWSSDSYGEFKFNERQHDNQSKTIFGKTDDFSGDDVLEMILENSNCARHIAKKVYRFFVKETLNDTHVEELANVFFESNYDIEVMMKHLFKSAWFYKEKGKLIKSPIDLIVGLGKMFELTFPDQKTLISTQYYLGQVLFDPPNVAGWPGGKHWIDASRLAFRLRLGSLIINKGVVVDELSPALDKQISSRTKKHELKFFETIDWERFWNRNKNTTALELCLMNQNNQFESEYNNQNIKSMIQLISTPDFQLI